MDWNFRVEKEKTLALVVGRRGEKGTGSASSRVHGNAAVTFLPHAYAPAMLLYVPKSSKYFRKFSLFCVN